MKTSTLAQLVAPQIMPPAWRFMRFSMCITVSLPRASSFNTVMAIYKSSLPVNHKHNKSSFKCTLQMYYFLVKRYMLHASGMAPGMTILLCLKYLNSYWIDCCECLHRMNPHIFCDLLTSPLASQQRYNLGFKA